MKHSRSMRWLRRPGPSLALVILCGGALAGTSPAQAAPPDRSGLFVHLGAAAVLFTQEGHAPPICCGERDSWTAVGPGYLIRPGWAFGRFLMISAELSYAFQLATAGDRDYELHRIGGALGADFVFPPIGPLSATAGFALALNHASGLFEAPWLGTAARRESAVLFGVQPRVGLDLFGLFGERFALGVEASYTKFFIVQNAWSFGLYATWHRIGAAPR